jgi:hypothetical protein
LMFIFVIFSSFLFVSCWNTLMIWNINSFKEQWSLKSGYNYGCVWCHNPW